MDKPYHPKADPPLIERCCCMSTRCGSIWTSALWLLRNLSTIGGMIAIVVLSIFYWDFAEFDRDFEEYFTKSGSYYIAVLYVAYFVVAVFEFVMSIYLMVGLNKFKLGYISVWIVAAIFQATVDGLSMGGLIVYLIVEELSTTLVPPVDIEYIWFMVGGLGGVQIIYFMFDIGGLVCVVSHRREIARAINQSSDSSLNYGSCGATNNGASLSDINTARASHPQTFAPSVTPHPPPPP